MSHDNRLQVPTAHTQQLHAHMTAHISARSWRDRDRGCREENSQTFATNISTLRVAGQCRTLGGGQSSEPRHAVPVHGMKTVPLALLKRTCKRTPLTGKHQGAVCSAVCAWKARQVEKGRSSSIDA